jgi:hypothetical protein
VKARAKVVNELPKELRNPKEISRDEGNQEVLNDLRVRHSWVLLSNKQQRKEGKKGCLASQPEASAEGPGQKCDQHLLQVTLG